MRRTRDIGEPAGCVGLILFVFANANIKTLMEEKEQTQTFCTVVR